MPSSVLQYSRLVSICKDPTYSRRTKTRDITVCRGYNPNGILHVPRVVMVKLFMPGRANKNNKTRERVIPSVGQHEAPSQPDSTITL